MKASSLLRTTGESFRRGDDLSPSVAEPFLDALITESDEKILADLFLAWNAKGLAEDEIYQIAKIMRERCTKVQSKHETFVDIVGTGGSRAKTFNVSTAAAFVVAGEGLPVAKHGNKAATSNSGSADVLSALGIEPSVDAATAERSLNEIGICFMYAPNFHRLSPTLARVRRGLGLPTIFNCVGPLSNPANPPHQLIGVWDKSLLPKMAGALARLGTKKSWIVHGEDGLDEISLNGRTHVAEVLGGNVNHFEISPNDFGMAESGSKVPEVGSPLESASLITRILKCEHRFDPVQELVLINSAAALCLTHRVADLAEGRAVAFDSVSGGHAMQKFDQLKDFISL
ncbi:MAG: anthranilate phosphoribosyltransferase [Acidobacteriota bacterium]